MWIPPAVAYQRVLHQLVRRELRMLAEVAAWAPADDTARIAELGRHAGLISHVLLHHHATEREALWPALLRTAAAAEVRATLDEWTAECARIDHMLRDVSTAARQWAVALTEPARDAFAMACLVVADAVAAQTAEEERVLLPLIAAHLPADDWTAIAHAPAATCPRGTSCSCSASRSRTPAPTTGPACSAVCRRSARWAWLHGGERRYRATVVRLRGEPPAR